ncbi:hypothetical protein TPHA_0G00660 [Tetrapisispora phaffii CBS 4417]|uniref:Protein DML1 n=1 Tax=Tetrapisispora phaffii (strain ATCC 24235 / CBS 4417 / NBRC 1672 / NRRL Y-8282 / UCD 70-5) TaxID=1071381 RepID=G8BVH4_TETPH|nr:hypothetical protein TPHA_0G00660 [Tetrapisispora phaffii CBS 4417]CCE63902.1 hypothetical protein TPHA_0G00660 [Tetrapisispora phaffii CBS 4417]
MHEIINISISHRSNHLTTQFYNNKEKLLYTEDRPNTVDVFLNGTKDLISKTASYSPRALLWDSKLGNGSLGTFQYSESNDYYDPNKENLKEVGESLVVTHPRIQKSIYQEALDSGAPVPKLGINNSRYWSDYSHLIYNSKSLQNLNSWYHDVENPNLPDFEKLGQQKFQNYETGFQEFSDNYVSDFFDINLHYQLEQCDSLQGFNLITDVDNAWGGFSTAVLQELKNELPKSNVFTWTFNEDDALNGKTMKERAITKQSLSRITQKLKASINLIEESDLFIPLYADPKLTNWELSSKICKIFDAVNSVFDQNNVEQVRSMEYLVNCISDGTNDQNIISNITESHNEDEIYSYFPLINKFDLKSKVSYHEFSNCDIIRESNNNETLYENEKDKNNNDRIHLRTLKTYRYFPSDTISDEYKSNNDSNITLASTEVCRNVFKHWNHIVTKYFRNDTDREQLKEDISSRAAAYEYGWYDDEDSGDDDY